MGRTYRLKRRADEQAATRQRIIDATIALHQERGDVGTTISAIADRAGVGRVTVYRHFPDERALLSACTGHYLAQNPPPTPEAWRDIADPDARLRAALGEMYVWYGRNERMWARAEEDAPTNPVLAELLAPFEALLGQIRNILMEDRTTADDATRPIMAAAIGHAIAFATWRSLVRTHGLDDAAAVALMAHLVAGAPEAQSAPAGLGHASRH
jgi:AcrR family transcriptional regulator